MTNLPLIALLVGAAVSLLTYVAIDRRRISSRSRLEVLREALDASEAGVVEKASVTERFQDYLASNGWDGKLTPIVAVAGLLYTVVAVGLRIVGLNSLVAGLVAAPAMILVVFAATKKVHSRRKAKFEEQLLGALYDIANEMEKNQSPEAAIRTVLPGLDSPVRNQFEAAVNRAGVSQELVTELAKIADVYPSKALDMFLHALKMNDASPTALAPAIRQAAEILRTNADLAAEGAAETSQARAEMYGLLGIVGIITLSIFKSLDGEMRASLLSGPGLAIVLVGAAWMLFGLYRSFRMLKAAEGGAQ